MGRHTVAGGAGEGLGFRRGDDIDMGFVQGEVDEPRLAGLGGDEFSRFGRESLRVELARFGVRVQTISPGFVRTPLTAKNRYAMPFLLDPGDFARRAVRAIDRGRSYATIPWQMGVVAKLLRVLPNAVFDRLFANRAYKPRKREM